jgi:hypothetical protein
VRDWSAARRSRVCFYPSGPTCNIARGGHADRFWAIALAWQKERGAGPSKGVEIGVRVLG